MKYRLRYKITGIVILWMGRKAEPQHIGGLPFNVEDGHVGLLRPERISAFLFLPGLPPALSLSLKALRIQQTFPRQAL